METEQVTPAASLTVRVTPAEQIAQALEVARSKNQPLRIRLPFGLYNYGGNRGYTFVRDAAWNLTLPSDLTTVEHVERYIEVIGRCIVAVTEQGPDAIMALLGEGPTQTSAIDLPEADEQA